MYYDDLANAIVLQAVEDYRVALADMADHPGYEEYYRRNVEKIEEFFFSPWCGMLTDLDPEVLAKKLRTETRGETEDVGEEEEDGTDYER